MESFQLDPLTIGILLGGVSLALGQWLDRMLRGPRS